MGIRRYSPRSTREDRDFYRAVFNRPWQQGCLITGTGLALGPHQVAFQVTGVALAVSLADAVCLSLQTNNKGDEDV
jgi:hypothetical protein